MPILLGYLELCEYNKKKAFVISSYNIFIAKNYAFCSN